MAVPGEKVCCIIQVRRRQGQEPRVRPQPGSHGLLAPIRRSRLLRHNFRAAGTFVRVCSPPPPACLCKSAALHLQWGLRALLCVTLSDRCDFTPPPSRFWLPGLPAWATGIATGSWKRRDGSALLKGAAKGVQPACYFTTLKQRLLPVYCAHPLRLRIRPMAARRTLQTPTPRVSTVFK